MGKGQDQLVRSNIKFDWFTFDQWKLILISVEGVLQWVFYISLKQKSFLQCDITKTVKLISSCFQLPVRIFSVPNGSIENVRSTDWVPIWGIYLEYFKNALSSLFIRNLLRDQKLREKTIKNFKKLLLLKFIKIIKNA